MITRDSTESRGRSSAVQISLVLVLAGLIVGGGLWIWQRGLTPAEERLAVSEEPGATAPAATSAPDQAHRAAQAPPPRFAKAPPALKQREPELSKDVPFHPQELQPPRRFRKDSSQVRDMRLNELITKANLDSAQTQKLLDFMGSTNAQLDQAFNQTILPQIPGSDPAAREKARLEFMKTLVTLSDSFDQVLAELGPQTQNAAKELGLDVTNLLSPDQAYQLRSFLKRFGRKHKMEPAPAPAPPPEPAM